jgi:hypothetical protein
MDRRSRRRRQPATVDAQLDAAGFRIAEQTGAAADRAAGRNRSLPAVGSAMSLSPDGSTLAFVGVQGGVRQISCASSIRSK